MTSNIVGALRLEQYISSLTEGHESTRFANAVLSVSMNKDRWNSLPPEIQSAFRKASDESFLRRIGQVRSGLIMKSPELTDLFNTRKSILF